MKKLENSCIIAVIAILLLSVSPLNAQPDLKSGLNASQVDLHPLRSFNSKFHFSATANSGNFEYAPSVEKALRESDYSTIVVNYPDYSVDDVLLDIFTFGLYSYGQSYGPIITYETPHFGSTSSLKLDLSYNLKPKLQLGFAYNSYNNAISVVHNPNHVKELDVEVKVNSFNAYTAYDVTEYKRKHKCGLGFRVGGGLTGNVVNESQVYNLYQNTNFSSTEYTSKKFQLGVMFNSKIDLFFGKHFSVILADITYNLPFYSSKIEQTSSISSEVSLKSHRINTSSFTYGFGLGLHF